MALVSIAPKAARVGPAAILIAVWLSIGALVASLLVVQFHSVDRSQSDRILSTLIPTDPAIQAGLVP